MADLNLPQYYQSPYYSDPQKKISDVSSRLVSGDIPDWLKPITQAGSQPFRDMLSQVQSGIQRNVLETGAKTGTRGGVMSDIIARQTAESTVPLNYQDYMNAMSGRERLFGAGMSGLEGVRGAGLQEMGQRNVYGMEKGKAEYQADLNAEQQEEAEKARKAQFISSIISTGIGAAGSLYGVSQYSNLLKMLSGGSEGGGYGQVGSIMSNTGKNGMGFIMD